MKQTSKKATDLFDRLKQTKNQTLVDFQTTFDAHVKIFEETTGTALPEQRKAYRFLDKLYKPKFGNWFDEMDQ